MTPDAIDAELDRLAEVAAATGDEAAGPGLIRLGVASWLAGAPALGAGCASVARGIRYRGVRIWVRSDHMDDIITRADAAALGVEFEPFEPVSRTPG